VHVISQCCRCCFVNLIGSFFFFFAFIWQFDLSFRQHVLRSADVRADRSFRTHCPGQFFKGDDREKIKDMSSFWVAGSCSLTVVMYTKDKLIGQAK
jgi:hypothetical protein